MSSSRIAEPADNSASIDPFSKLKFAKKSNFDVKESNEVDLRLGDRKSNKSSQKSGYKVKS